ncbi:MAG: hypothetical protein Q4G23_05505 [Clostridia bacterium]|nr:hypothetical protein [Clostridia bacterium]
MKKFVAGSLIVFLLAMAFFITGTGGDAFAAEIQKNIKKYEIAVVYDNSGSMYNNTKAWCRAKYAMEIFASMLNYDNGDVLKIFPMWNVTTDGSTPASGGSYAPISIKSIKDIDKISNIYTPVAGDTPFAPAEEAFAELQKSNADVKWLVVLTDGGFNQRGRGAYENVDLQGELETMVGIRSDGSFQSTGINIQYLGIGNAVPVAENKNCNLHSKKSTDNSLKDDLVKICNDIFKRSELPSGYISGNSINFDISMRNVIVFAQGEGAKISGLKTPDGDTVEDIYDSGQRMYSELSAGGYDTFPDISLAGQVVTFDACPKGEGYTLDCTGAEKIQVFYDPNVDIKLSLINSDGTEVDLTSGEIAPGEYTVEYKIVDAVYPENDVTNSDLMGGGVDFTSYVERSDGSVQEFKNGDKVSFEPDEETDIVVEGTYLEDYKISSKDNPSWSFKGIKVNLPEIVNIDVNLSTKQMNNWFVTGKQDKWEPLIAKVTLGGNPLSDEELANVKFDFEISDGVKYTYKQIPGESAYEIYIFRGEDGADIKPETGHYTAKATVEYTDEHGQVAKDEDKLGFDVAIYSVIWRWLIWVIILAAIALLIWFILSRKAWPKNMRFEATNGAKKAKISVNKTINIVSNAYPGVLPCSAEKNSTLYHRSKRTASVKITKVTPSFKVVSFRIGGSPTYTKENGVYRDSNGKEFSPIVVRNNTKVIVEIKGGMPIEGIVYINSKKK